MVYAVVPINWLFGFLGVIILMMIALCLIPMLRSRPRILTGCPECPCSANHCDKETKNQESTTTEENGHKSIPRYSMVEMKSMNRPRFLSDGTLEGFNKFVDGIDRTPRQDGKRRSEIQPLNKRLTSVKKMKSVHIVCEAVQEANGAPNDAYPLSPPSESAKTIESHSSLP